MTSNFQPTKQLKIQKTNKINRQVWKGFLILFHLFVLMYGFVDVWMIKIGEKNVCIIDVDVWILKKEEKKLWLYNSLF